MATRYGFATLEWLMERGWKVVPFNDDEIGDQRVFDPVTKKTITVYEAADLQKERTGEYPEFLPNDE